jgi:hypothetical protein
MTRRTNLRNPKNGLILLIVLGMLGLFTLLAVTFVVTAGSSRAGSKALEVKARNGNLTIAGTAKKVLEEAVRGTNNQKSPFYNSDLLGDIFDKPIRTTFGPYNSNFTVVRFHSAGTNVNLVKVSLNPVAQLNGPLSNLENEYNSRVLTVLEGPLAGQSFRILKYVGYVGNNDPNIDGTAWSNKNYTDPLAADISYSILLDLDEIQGTSLTGQYLDPDGSIKTVSLTLEEWVSKFGKESLFFFFNGSNQVGYKLLINGAAFNNAGIGMEDIALLPPDPTAPPVPPPAPVPVVGFGSLDSRRLLRIPSTRPKIPPALLAHYDYLQDPTVMAQNPYDGTVGVDEIGVNRSTIVQSVLNGRSNEGWDAADFHDFWLAHQSYNGNGVPTITPSFHKPAVINYITHLFGDPSSMTATDVNEMLKLIDASSGRLLSYLTVNSGFQTNNPNAVRLPASFTWSTPPSALEIGLLRTYVFKQIMGPWDVDNDGDGIPDSVWMDPGLPVVFAPDGRRLRPLAAVLIEDLDGRINLNTSGDRVQGCVGYDASTNQFYKRPNQFIPQGFGYGPAEISLSRLFRGQASLLASNPFTFSFFDELYGARRFTPRNPDNSINYASPYLDRYPGQRRLPTENTIGYLNERENHTPFQHNRMPGMPMSRRGGIGLSFDLNGNPAFVNPMITDAEPGLSPFGNSVADETYGDKYESTAMDTPISDDPLGLRDLEAILRRFDEDASARSDRLPKRLGEVPGYNKLDYLNREITTRSAELRYPNLVSGLKVQNAALGAPSIAPPAAGYLRYIQMLHSQRYRVRTFPAVASDDPEISNAALAELFPMDFAKGLKMDLNRPFADGVDNDGGGQIDEPYEIANQVQTERFPLDATNFVSTNNGLYTREIQPGIRKTNAQVGDTQPDNRLFSSTRGRLGSRQLLARNLYCLAQLLVAKDFQFPGMASATTNLQRAQIRARALAQWAVNVVDFRDADSAMTRFEFDIFPFGVGTNRNITIGGVLAERPAYWAPDRIEHSVNGINNKSYVGVVWGMEMPELLLTETLAFHNKRLKDTDMDSSGKTTTDPTTPDNDLDQIRFPEASLFLEIFATRTTDSPANGLIPGAPSSLYGIAPNPANGNASEVQLDLGRLAPAPPVASPTVWGVQPVWRIAISEPYPASSPQHPNAILKNSPTSLATITHQWNASGVTGSGPLAGFPARDGVNSIARGNAVDSIEQYVGSDIRYDLVDPATLPPNGFERFVWFTNVQPGVTIPASGLQPARTVGPRLPDLIPALTNREVESVYSNQAAVATNPVSVPLAGGSYLVVGPRSQTSVGSLTHNQFTGTLYANALVRSSMSTPTNVPILSPAEQRIELNNTGVDTYLINNELANPLWTSPIAGRPIKTPTTLICAAPAPAGWNTPLPSEPGGTSRFPGGIGLNISFPTPIAGQTIWQAANLPTARLNSNDVAGSRADGTPGFGTTTIPADSWVDLSATPITGAFPDTPIDQSNPLLAGRYTTGTYENVRVAYLQRLADPDFHYDPVINPYITVDWMPIDLTVFNGDATLASDPEEINPTPTIAFQSRYKTGELSPLATGYSVVNKGVSYHSPKVADLRTSPIQSNPSTATKNRQSYFMYQLGYNRNATGGDAGGMSATTLGYVNTGLYRDGTTNGTTLPTQLDLQGSTYVDYDAFGPPRDAALFAYKGAPARMANVMWLNRPFASPYEIMMVPLTGPGQFGLYHSAAVGAQLRDPFKNLLPSFQTMNAWNVNLPASGTSPGHWAIPVAPPSGALADWPLLLEFVETQPPFADANKYYRPDTMEVLANSNPIGRRFMNSFLPPGYTIADSNILSDIAASEPSTVRGPTYLAPFNIKPSYVAAGKINLNTISFDSNGQSRALKALENNYLAYERGADTSSFAANFFQARQGYGGVIPQNDFLGAVVPGLHPEFPTQFAGAFRPALSSNLAPPLNNPQATERLRSKYGVETMLMRSNFVDANNQATPSNNDLLLAPPAPVVAGDEQANVQPFVRLQRAMRLPNLATNQSNVFAIWVTVSLYEFDPIRGFGNEYVGETGMPERERQFFIVDRSIPVGYKQGENLNTDRTILLQRKLP